MFLSQDDRKIKQDLMWSGCQFHWCDCFHHGPFETTVVTECGVGKRWHVVV